MADWDSDEDEETATARYFRQVSWCIQLCGNLAAVQTTLEINSYLCCKLVLANRC